jgi:Flagellar hook-length control protein FliK
MSVSPVASPQAAAQLALLLQPDPGLAAKLQLGQIVQGQVLRHFEGSRYLVRVLGHDAVVDSASALRPNETLHGRVIGLKDRVELERINPQDLAETDAASQDSGDRFARLGGGRAAEIIEELFQRHRGVLEGRDADELERAVRRAARPDRVALAGLVLRKVGLPIDAGLLDSLSQAIGGRFGGLAPLGDSALELELARAQAPGGGIAVLSDAISSLIAPVEAKDSSEKRRSEWPLSQWVLNAQGGGSVAHQVGMLPLELGGADIRVEYAVFEEGEGGTAGAATLRHRKLVLAFELEGLGRVEIRAVTAGDHIRVALATDSRAQTNALLRHGEALVDAFNDGGWKVDEIAYETRTPEAPGGAVSAAIEHLIAPGSVSKLI